MDSNKFTNYLGRAKSRLAALPRNKRIGLSLAALILIGAGIVALAAGQGRELAGRDHIRDDNFISDGRQTEAKSPLAGKKLYVFTDNPAAKQADSWRQDRPGDAVLMDKLAAQPVARWIGNKEDFTEVTAELGKARQQQAVPVLVLYNIPNRDCGLYSAGGAANEAEYKSFVDEFAATIGDTEAIIIVEPDAIPQIGENDESGKPCLDDAAAGQRTGLLAYAVRALKAKPNTYVYLDAGNSSWELDPSEMSRRLREAAIAEADGFSINVSNFRSTAESTAYGVKLSGRLNRAHFIIDTSRNGLGAYDNKKQPEYNWCNPPGRSLGRYPTFDTGHPRVDALLYVKVPGESDGTDDNFDKCFGGPKAGEWWPDYALGLVQRWPKDLQPPQ